MPSCIAASSRPEGTELLRRLRSPLYFTAVNGVLAIVLPHISAMRPPVVLHVDERPGELIDFVRQLVELHRHARDVLVGRVAIRAPQRGLVVRIELVLRRPARNDQRPLGQLEIDEQAVFTGRHRGLAEHQRHFGHQPRRLVRAGAPHRRRREARRADVVGGLAVVGAGAEQIAAALQRPAVPDLDPLAARYRFRVRA